MLLSLLAALTQLAIASPASPASGPGEGTDSVLADAQGALSRGRPWQASRLIAPVLADSTRRTPAVVFLAATAASEWGGWSEVDRLLADQPWLDSLYDGRGRMLLARASLERGADSVALGHALAALAVADSATAGERLLLLAESLDRVDARDSAAATYLRAAERLPLVAAWLRLRAAVVTDDSASRAVLYAGITEPLPRDRADWSEAAAHERIGNLEEAARRYAALGARVTAFRLQLEMSADSAPRAAVRAGLLDLIGGSGGAAESREAIGLLDSLFAPLSSEEELTVARAAGQSGLASRAVTGYARAIGAGLGTSEDRFGYGNALARLCRNNDAAFQLNLVTSPRSLAADAAYLRARSLVRDGQLSEGRSALLEIAQRYPRDTTAASSALYLLADLAADNRNDVEARTYYRRVSLRYPSSRFAPVARFNAAMIVLLRKRPAVAAREFDQLARRYPRSDEAVAALYWAGRAWAAAGDSAAARARWKKVAAGDPASYYTGLALRRLGRARWVPPQASDSFIPVPDVDTAVARAALLGRLGFLAESRWEYDRLVRTADTSAERLLALANALRQQGLASQAIQLGRRALARGAEPDARTYRLIYPVVLDDALAAEAAEQGLTPSFVAALIRQESMFNPGATSPVGARGLMQVMPDLGEQLAQSLGYPVWDPVLLYQADVSLQLGSYHLRELAGRYQQHAHVLAAYNAGVSRVERWMRRRGVKDPEVFAERIPYTETRGYVKVIQRNQEIYKVLYRW
jgi:soluble lytic murein transglycosylase-like protein